MNQPIPPSEHAPHCPGPEYEWQQQIWPGTPVRGRCVHCGAIAVDRSAQPARRVRTRGGAA